MCIDWFEPAYKAGGPIRSVSNLARLLQDDYEIFVFTSDHDLNSTAPLENILTDQWTNFDRRIKVYYSSVKQLRYGKISSLIKSVSPDYIYCSGLYSKYFTLYPLLIQQSSTTKTKFIIAPHGMLRESALSHKKLKKKSFLSLFRLTGFHKKIHFHASDENELADIRIKFPHAYISAISDAPSQVILDFEILDKQPSELRIIFIGRIHPIKNLDFLLKALKNVSGNVVLTIAGHIEDLKYWNVCQREMQNLPSNIKVIYKGESPHQEINQLIKAHHLYSLPTTGENFGHSIFEALACGRPVLISDQTPWKNLEEKHAGWDLSISDPYLFQQHIQKLTDMQQEEYNKWCLGAFAFAERFVLESGIREKYLKLFTN